MLVKEFLDIVAAGPEAPLLFSYDPDKVVAGGFHVTEIKNTTYETIDCGNSLHTWNEVIVQLWVPEDVEPGADRMTAGKFMKIWDVVDSRIRLDLDAEIRFEYGDAATRTSLYHVDSTSESDTGLEVTLGPPRTLCKPREILVDLNPASETEACCTADAAPTRTETILPLPTRASSEETGCC
jgi:hypothetical protein